METLHIAVDQRGVARLTMTRPEVFNAFNEAMIDEMAQAVARLSADPHVRIVVLAGAGKAFSAGADLQWMQRAAQATQDVNLEDARRFAGMLQALADCPKPTLARVHGLALGGGVGLAAACDIALATPDAKFAVSEARFGILPAVIGPYVINAVGPRQARRLALTASRIPASEALALGLVQEVAEDIDAALERWIAELLLNGPGALGEIKALFAQLEVGPVTPAVRELTAQTIARVRMGQEAREGFAAFLAKRPAAWVPHKD
ncbi:MAG: enoyl-CoA hydratase-related protein [Roseateles asaccharophilus]|uniref:Methylglutaconyl-CoA hydratase n=1 Tax=Roseateles asaccharophilus TaxID=582607 RepID=A0A4R6NC78_9BURK|nr:enoyl-CoA hydratase-related protein [Roseateles asaccharophilus]MDN3542872.1 enoyl-CoA hydratase-related protein [Roseateles asaccharophilus]TDP13429.1 methylglutaconyl-CoA hydratase [Roseateles asaccharophilus]